MTVSTGVEDPWEGSEDLELNVDVDVVNGTLHLRGDPALAELEAEEVLPLPPAGHAPPPAEGSGRPVRALNVAMLVVGTRGDAQPFVALGLRLQAYGHRVRLATHEAYRDFVVSAGLEFYPLGGDPAVLSEFVVSNRGIVPRHLRDATGGTREVRSVVFSTLKACTQPDPGAEPGVSAPGPAFTADAIIANPPSYGHIHVAEKMRVPLHVMFTMPWTPTGEFPSPLTNTAAMPSRTLNRLSYKVVDDFVNLGLGPVINEFREEELGLPPLLPGDGGASLIFKHSVPFAYCFSPALVPKPADWPAWVDVVGYYVLPGATSQAAFTPAPELEAFLAAGPPPAYVGFGSLVVDDPAGLTSKIVEAGRGAGVRLLIAKGWGGLGAGLDPAPEGVHVLTSDTPHDWLLPRCSAVVHHGGAGTTCAGILALCPTTIVPFFGDQYFWGAAVARMGAGPAPIPIDKLTAAKLGAAFEFMQRPECKAAAEAAAAAISAEDGVTAGMEAFHRQLPEYLRGEEGAGPPAGGGQVDWQLTRPHLGDVLSETAGGLMSVVVKPVTGAAEGGLTGALEGAVSGLRDLNLGPAKGLWHSAQAAATLGTEGAAGAARAVRRLRLVVRQTPLAKALSRQKGPIEGAAA